MADKLTFYTSPMSRGRVVRWMLEEVGAPYETELMDFAKLTPGCPYSEINPMLKVPAIVHGDKVVTETAAICTYLADVFPQAGLGPRPEEKADYYRWMFFAAGPGEAAMVNHTLKVDVAPEMQRMVGYGSYERMVGALEQAVSKHEYVTGPRFTAADVYVGSQIGWGTMVGSLPKRAAFDAYLGRIMARPAGVRARAIDDALLAKK